MAAAYRWRRDPGNSSTEIERELYERARDATKEAQKEGDAQLQAAVAAAAATPVRQEQYVSALPQMSTWLLKFSNPRLEKAYERKSTTNAVFFESIPSACELAFCVCQIWFEFWLPKADFKEKKVHWRFNHLYGHACSAAVSTLVLVLQLVFMSWYKGNRGRTLCYYAWTLWIWESLKLFLTTDKSVSLIVSAFFRCILISLIYQVPFCMQLRSRMYAICCQILAIMARGRMDGMQELLLSIIAGHLIGVILAYRLDLRARNAFLQSLPKYLVDNSSGYGSAEQFLSYRDSFSRQVWSIFYPELFDKSECTNQVGSLISERSVPRRALGGFAGGFGGVSGLKCSNPVTAVPLSSSSNSSSRQELSDSSDDEQSVNSEILESQMPNGLGKANQLWFTHESKSRLSPSSACSKVGSGWNRSVRSQAQRRRNF